MKPLALTLLAAALAGCIFSSTARADTGPVHLTVVQDSKTDTNKETKVHHRVLKITLVNSGPDSLALRVKYAFFGRAAGSHDTIVIHHSDLTTQLQPKSDQTLTTATQSATMTDEHFVKGKKVAATGQHFTGYGVKVYQDGKVIAETCDPPSMQDDLAKMPGLPEPKPKPAPPKPAAKPAPKPKPATPAPATPAPAAK